MTQKSKSMENKMTWLQLAQQINSMPAKFLAEPVTIQAGSNGAFFVKGLTFVEETWFNSLEGHCITYTELRENTPEPFCLADHPIVYAKGEPYMDALTTED